LDADHEKSINKLMDFSHIKDEEPAKNDTETITETFEMPLSAYFKEIIDEMGSSKWLEENNLDS